MVIKMKKNDMRYPLIIRFGLFAVLVTVQLTLIYANIFQPLWYGKLFKIIIGLCCGVVMIFVISILVLAKRPYFFCVLLDCLGVAISFLCYLRFVAMWEGDNLIELRRFIMVPYLICGTFSLIIWKFIKKTEFNIVFFSRKYVVKHKKLLNNIVVLMLSVCALIFLSMTLYFFFAIKNGLLAGWSLLTSVLAYFLMYTWKKATAD